MFPTSRERLCRVGVVAILTTMASAALLSHATAQAPQTPLSGTWRTGASAIDVAVESWGADCGARPQAQRAAGGGVVGIVQTGKQLAIQGRDQNLRSDACWSHNPLIHKESSSVVDGLWVTRCKTAQNDPREEQGTYTLKLLAPGTLLYQDVSRYNWALNQSRCTATFTTTQTLTRAGANVAAARAPVQAPPPTAAASAPAKTEPSEPACKAGPPAHLTLRPKRSDIEVGQRVCFRARLSDAADCAIPAVQVEWSLNRPKARKAELSDGCFVAGTTAAEAEGDFKVSASAQGQHADAVVVVRSVDLSALIAKRMEGGALSGFAEEPAPVRVAPKAAARITTRTVAEQPRGGLSVGLTLGLGALLLLLLGVQISKRKALAARAAKAGAERDRDRKSGRLSAPSSGRASAPARAAQPRSAEPSQLAASPSVRPAAEATPANEPWICPLCRLGFPADRKTCPRDGSPLMPYAEFSKQSRATEETRQKRCPKCGDLFPANTAFCGTDGASLVDA